MRGVGAEPFPLKSERVSSLAGKKVFLDEVFSSSSRIKIYR